MCGMFVVFVQFGVFGGDAAEHLVGHGGQFAGLAVHQRQLPFHTKS